MNNNKDQIELSRIIAQTTELPQSTVDAFVRHLFIEIKNNLEPGSSVSVEGLGIFRVIKSGDSNKILFLGSKKNITESIDPSSFKDELEGKTVRKKTQKNILSISDIDRTHIKPSIPSLTEKPLKKDLLDKIDRTEIPVTETKKADSLKEEKTVIPNNNTSLKEENFFDNTDSISKSTNTKEEALIKEKQEEENQTNDDLRKKQLNREEKKRGAIILPIFIALLVLIAIIGIGYLFFENAKINNSNKQETITQTPVTFEELAVTDSTNLSYMVIPNKYVSLEYIANHYYGNELFWPYIYVENKDFMTSSTIVSAGSIVKIPKLIINLIDYNDGSTIRDAQILGDEIKKSRKIY